MTKSKDVIEISRSRWGKKKHWLIKKNIEFIKKTFSSNKPICLTRAGAGTFTLLTNPTYGTNHDFRLKLARSCAQTDILGLQLDDRLNSDERQFEKIIRVCRRFKVEIDFNKVVSARIFLLAPEILPAFINNKKVLWINYNAHKFPDLLRDKKYRNYYGLDNIESCYIDIPDGMVIPYDVNIVKLQTNIINQLDSMEFEIAIIGAGASSNYICIYIRDVLGKSAANVGCVLSAMKGQRDRGGFKKGRALEFLVWE